MKLTLEALQAADGDCLLVHHERNGAMTRVLVDGGSKGIYSKVLRKRLDELRGDEPPHRLRPTRVSPFRR